MGKYAQIVIGPAGSGKSTYCHYIQQHGDAARRTVHVANLDPAAESFSYTASIDIRELVSLDEVMEELDYGPNGGLVYCMEYLVNNMDWLADKMEDYADDYVVFDCPGQIELYCHLPVMKSITNELQRLGYNVCVVYCLDSVFVSDAPRFVAGTMMCMAAMFQLELPHVNVLTKVDMIKDKDELDQYLEPDCEDLLNRMTPNVNSKFHGLNTALSQLIHSYNMVSFIPLDISDEDSIEYVLSTIDQAIQYGEDLEPKEPIEREDVENPNDEEGTDALMDD